MPKLPLLNNLPGPFHPATRIGRRLVAETRAYLKVSSRRGLYLRGALALVTLLFVGAGLLTWSVVAGANQAQAQARQLAGTLQATQPGALSDPATYAEIAAQAAETHRLLSSLRARLGWLRPVDWMPFAGSQLSQARDTAELGVHLALGVETMARLYEDMLLRRQDTSGAVAAAAIAERQGPLEEAAAALERASELTRARLLLDGEEAVLVIVGVPLLQAAVTLAQESPSGSEALLDVLTQAERLSQFAADPWEIAANAEPLEHEARKLAGSAEVIAREAAQLAEQRRNESAGDDRTAASLEMVADAALAVAALGRTGEALAGVVRAMGRGFLSAEFGMAAAGLLAAASDSGSAAEEHIAAFQARTDGLLADAGGDYRGVEGGLHHYIQALSDDVSRLSRMTHALRSGLGYEGERVYLMVFQNQNEIRATGGFIGVTMELHIENGTLLDVVYEESTNLDPPPLIDNPAAPEPLYWYLWMGRLLFRDANWSPHFPDSAETLRAMYRNARGVDVDGVIAGTKLLAWDLVDVLGDVYVPHVNQALTRELTMQYTEGLLPYPCDDRHASGRDKRCFDQDLAVAMLDRLMGGEESVDFGGLLTLVERHITKKDLLFYMVEPSEAALLAEQQWDGAVRRLPAQDHLMVIDSSLPGHTTAEMVRSWDYRVDLQTGGNSRAELLLVYENLSPLVSFVCRQTDYDAGGCYWNYVRIYLPSLARDIVVPPVGLHEGTEKLTWGHPDIDSAEVFVHADGPMRGLTEVGAYLTVEPDSVFTFPISYGLAPGAVQRLSDGTYRYRLMLAKQPGMNNDQVRVSLRLPDGARLVNASSGAQNSGGMVTWEFTLTGDTELSVVFR